MSKYFILNKLKKKKKITQLFQITSYKFTCTSMKENDAFYGNILSCFVIHIK